MTMGKHVRKSDKMRRFARNPLYIVICLAIIISSLPILYTAVQAEYSGIRIENADFSAVREDGSPEGWTASAVSGAFGGLKQKRSADHTGEYAALFSSDGVWNMDTSVTSPITVAPNTKYELSYFAKLDGKDPSLSVWYMEYRKDGSLTGTDWRIVSDCTLNSGRGWNQYAGSFTTSNEAKYLALRFSVRKGTAGIDDVSLTEKRAFKAAPMGFETVNLVPNGDFEENFANWDKIISGGATVETVNSPVASGEKAVRMTLPTASAQGYLQGYQFSVNPSANYILTYQLKIEPKGSGNGAQCYALIYEFNHSGSASGGLISTTGRWNTNNGAYETITYEFTTGKDTEKIRIDLMHNGVAGTSYWDDVSIVAAQEEEPIETGDNLLFNGGFERDFDTWQKSLSGAAAVSIVGDPVAEGAKALKMSVPSASAQCYLQGTQFNVKPSTAYLLSYKLKIDHAQDGNNAQCYALLYTFDDKGNPSGGLLSSTGRWNTAGDGYETVTYTFETAENIKTARIDLMHNGVAGTSYWDDVSVKETVIEEEDDGLLKNGTFTKGSENWSFNGNVSVQDKIAVKGKALKIESKDSTSYAQSNFFRVEPGNVYTISYDINVTEVADESVGVNFSSFVCADGYWLDFATDSIYAKTDGFVSVKTAVTIPENVESIAVGLKNYVGAGVSYWDNVWVEKTDIEEEDDGLLKNGTFARGSENWSLSGHVSVQDEIAVKGKALKIESKDSIPSYAQSNFFRVEPGRIYIISYDINVTEVADENAGVNFSSFVCADGYWLDFATDGIYKKTDGFVSVKTAVTIPENVEFIAIGLKNYGGAGTGYYDNVKVTLTDLDGTDPNLDFEANEEMILNWSFSTDNGSLSATDEVRDGSTGKVAAKIVNETAAGYATLKTKYLPVRPDTLYQFSYWIKAEGDYTAGSSLVFRQITADGKGASAIVSEANAPTVNVEKHQAASEFVHADWTYRASADREGWQNVVYSVKTASDAAFMEIHISVTGGACIAVIDDVSLTKITEDPNLDFENISDVTGVPENWHMSVYHQTAKGMGYDDSVYHSGKRSLYVEKRDDLEKVFIQSPVRFAVNKNDIYEFSAYVASRNASPDCAISLDLIMYDENGEQLYNDAYGNLTTVYGEKLSLNGSSKRGKWKKMMTRSVMDARAAYATLSFTITHGSADIWLDDVFFNVVANNVDTIVDYNDFHAVDQDGNVAGWTVTGSGDLTVAPFTKNNKTAYKGVFKSGSATAFMKHTVDFHETEYTYCVKGDLTTDTPAVAQMRFYDYKGNEYKNKRVEAALNPAQKSFELNYVAPSCTTAALLIGGGSGTVEVKNVTFYQTGAPASKTQWQGKWVWYNEDPYKAQDDYRYFRYHFELEDGVKEAPFQITVDDKFALYANGEEVINNWDAGGDSWSNVISLDLKKYLKKGDNVLAIKAYNYVSEAGVLFDGKFTLNNSNTVSVYSSAEAILTTKKANDKTLDWTKVGFDDKNWLRTKEFGSPPCSPWGPVHYNSSLYIHNAAKVLSTDVPEIVSAGGMMEFSLTMKLDSKMESNFTPKVTIWRKNSLLSLASSSIRFADHKDILNWPVGKEFTVKCELDIPSYLDTGKYVLQMDENAVLLSGDDVFDNKFIDFKVQGDKNAAKSLVSKIENYNGTPTLTIDGEPYGSFFYLRPDLDVYLSTDAETRIYKSDLDLYITYGGSLYKGGANGSNPIWREDGTIDYDAFDSTIYDTLAANGNAYVMVNIGMFAPPWWLESHPEDVALALGIDGKPYPQSDVSMSSETFRKEAGEVLRKLVRHMKSQTYYNRVFGIKISGGQTYEWMNWGEGVQYGPDYSEASKNGFKKYLKKKYGTTAALRKAWNDSDVTFETAASPTFCEKSYLNYEVNKSLYLGSVAQGRYPRNMVDWNLWMSESVTDSFLYYCKIAKEETDNNLIVGGYNGYIWTFNSYDAHGKAHTSIDRVLDSEYVDWIASPENYGERMLGESNTYMTMTGSVMSHGKIYICEQDNRTCLSTTYGSSWDAEWSFSTGVEHTLQNTIRAEKRDFAHALIDGSGEWLYDMYGGWLDDDQMYDFISDSKAEFDFSLNVDRDNLNDVAVIVGDESYAYMAEGVLDNMQYTINYALLQVQRKHLAAMGAGYDTYVMSSFLDNKVPEHKVYIILSPTQIDAKMNTALNKYLKVNGHCVVWVYLPGLSDGSRYDLKNIKKVTGFSIGAIEDMTNETVTGHSLRVRITDDSNPLTKGLKGVTYGDKTPNGISPAAYIADTDNVTVLGTNVETGKPGLGIKKMDGWTSIYSTAPCLTSDLLRNLLKMNGCHVYSENNDDIIYNNNHYVALHSGEGGKKTVTLPENHSVYDVYAEKFISMDTARFSFTAEPSDTHVFRLLTPNTYAVTSRVKGGHGKISTVGLTEVSPGDDFSLKITPDKGYEIAAVTVNGEKTTVKNGLLTIENINCNYTIIVTFSRIPEVAPAEDKPEEKDVPSKEKEAEPEEEVVPVDTEIEENTDRDPEREPEKNSTSHHEKIKRVEKTKVPVIGAFDVAWWVLLLIVVLIVLLVFWLWFLVKRKKDEDEDEKG